MTPTEGTEIERRFLVSEPPEDLEDSDVSDLRQGYLAVGEDGTEVRIRERDATTTLTVKQGHGRVRAEEEVNLDSGAFERLWRLTEGRRLEKRRHLIPQGDLTIELDVYTANLTGLIVAEVEFASEAEAEKFEPPAWLGTEVTNDRRFSNQRLAIDGRPG